MPDPRSNDGLWTAAEVADYLKVAEGTINQWAKAGDIPVVKVGSRNRFRRADIDAWLDSNARPAERAS